MSDSGETTTTNLTTFFDDMPVEDFISRIEEFLDQPTNTFEIDEDLFEVPGFEESCDDEPTSFEAPIVDEPTSMDDEACDDEFTPADSNFDFDVHSPYSEYEGWGDAEFDFDPTDNSYTQWSNAYEYAHDYANAVWGDSNSW